MQRIITAITLLVASISAQAVVINLFETNRSLTHINQAERLIDTSSPTLSFNRSIINFKNNFPGGRRNTFAVNALGSIDTNIHNSLVIQHDDGFRLRINGVVVAEFARQTAPRNTFVNLAAAGLASFQLTYFENRGREVLRVFDRRNNGFRFANIGNPLPASVPEPGNLALFGLGLISLVVYRRRLSR